MNTLLDPVKLGNNEFKNRVFMAPLTRSRADDDTDTPTDMMIEYYRQRASAGMIISEATQISPMGKGYIKTPGIYSDDHIKMWKKITDAIHKEGGKIFCQLWHVGRISHSLLLPEGAQPLAPSSIQADVNAYTSEGEQQCSIPKEMTKDDIRKTIEDYKKAAENAKKAGFDGVEIHAANGYLLNQFLEDKTNKRSDEYGGSIENRIRFLSEVTDAVCDVWSKDQVGIRLSPTGNFNDIDDSDPFKLYQSVIDMLNKKELAYLHMVEKFPGADVSNKEFYILSELIKSWNGFYISNGNYNYMDGQDAVGSGRADAVAYGRPFIANPDLPYRFEIGAELNKPDEATFYQGGEKGYTDYPFLKDADDKTTAAA